MSTRIIKINYDNTNLVCDYSKQKILIGEKYCSEFEIWFGDWFIDRNYKIEYMNKSDRKLK